MKKTLLVILFIFLSSISAWCGEFEDIKKSAEQGNAKAQINLGIMYDYGEGVPQDYKQAVYWYKKAAEQGLAEAQYNLGVKYHLGRGVPQNYKLAYVWFSLAAAQGHENAKKVRDIAAERLSSEQILQAQELSVKIQYKIDHPTE